MSPPPTDDPPANDDATVLADTPCVSCGYNLRGLAAEGRCPECNTPLEWSLGRYRLCFAESGWVESLARGTGLIVGGVIAAILVLPAVTFSLIIPGWIAWIAPVLCGIAWIGATTGGAYLLTTREPHRRIPDEPQFLRRAIRVCMVLSLVGIVMGLAFEHLGGIAGEVIALLAGLLILTRAIQNFGELVYLRRLARRVPDADLVRATSRVLWAVIGTFGVLLLSDACIQGANALGVAALIRIANILKDLANLAVFPVALWYTYLLIRYKKTFAAVAKSCVSSQGE
jgi:hypothetical protein